MPSTIQSNFSGGEWAPEYHGRTDLDAYKHAVKRARNMVVMPQGGMTRRPGFNRIAAALYNAMAQTTRVRAWGFRSWGLVIAAATLLTHQHHLLDVFSGYLLALGVVGLGRRTLAALNAIFRT